MTPRALFVVGVLVAATTATVVIPAPAYAQAQKQKDPVTAADWNRRGVEFRRAGEHEKALEAFQRADAVARTPKSRAQMGLVEHDLGKYVAAEEHLDEALAAKNDPWVSAHRQDLVAARDKARTHLGSVLLTGGQPGAVVTIQAKPIGNLPIEKPIRVEEGDVLITVTAPGWLTWQERRKVAVGDTPQQVSIDMVPDRQSLPDIVPPPASRTAPPPITKVPALASVDVVPTPSSPAASKYQTTGWVLIGLGAVAAAASGIHLYSISGKTCADGVECRRRPSKSWGHGGLAAAGVFVVGGVTLLAW